MDISINGSTASLEKECTLEALLLSRKLNPAVLLVERNGEIVPAGTFAEVLLCEGDSLEILHFVGGG